MYFKPRFILALVLVLGEGGHPLGTCIHIQSLLRSKLPFAVYQCDYMVEWWYSDRTLEPEIASTESVAPHFRLAHVPNVQWSYPTTD